jgi:hypothetical protein
MAMGQAAGSAAAMAARQTARYGAGRVRSIDVAELRGRLVVDGAILELAAVRQPAA